MSKLAHNSDAHPWSKQWYWHAISRGMLHNVCESIADPSPSDARHESARDPRGSHTRHGR